jgi:Ulp1 family protease
VFSLWEKRETEKIIYRKRIMYYNLNSSGGDGDNYMALVMRYLEREHQDKLGTPLDQSKWTCSSLGKTVPQQTNKSDCGMFTCMFATTETDTLVRGGSVLGLPLDFH